MRALFVAAPGIGHAFPMVPLAWALRSAGHEVAVAAAGDALVVGDAGLPVLDAAPGVSMRSMIAELAREEPELVEAMRATRIRKIQDFGQVMRSPFGRVLGRLTGDYVRTAVAWRPDLLITSPVLPAGYVAAAELDVPVVAHGFGLANAAEMVGQLRGMRSEVFAEHGGDFPADVPAIEVAPPSLLAEDFGGWPMRYLPYNGGDVTPQWLLEPAERPRVAVTLGTVAPRMNGLGEVERVLAAAPEVDAEFVLALGETDLSGLGELPPNVRAVDWIPLNALLRTCSAVIHHGGAGTTLTSLDAGVPQLVTPNGADRYINADAVSNRGCALSVEVDDLDARAIQQLITDPELRGTAQAVRTEMHQMPSPAQLVPRLAGLV